MFYIQESRDITVSLNTEILEKPWKSIKVTPFHKMARWIEYQPKSNKKNTFPFFTYTVV